MAGKMADIDSKNIELLASKFCTKDEISRMLDFDQALFDKRQDAALAFEKGRNAARVNLRTFLLDTATGGDRQAAIFLAKNELGYGDNPSGKAASGDVPSIIDDVGVGEGYE